MSSSGDQHSAVMAELPAPQPGLRAEITFRRQLRACEDVMRGRNTSRPEFATWQSSPVFHKVCLSHQMPATPRLYQP